MRRGRRLIRRRWLRWSVRGILLLAALATLFSFSYNLATDGAEKPARALYGGPYLRVDGRSIAYRSFGSRGTPIPSRRDRHRPPRGPRSDEWGGPPA
jgi:hypothetical protein